MEPGELPPNQTAASPTYASYRYDAAGNQTERYYPAGSPASGSGASSETFLYVYDGEDRLRRVTKKVAGVVMGSEEYWYDEQGARVGVLKRDGAGTKQELRWFIGDTQAHYDGAGAVTKVYSHLSLGTPIARVERTGNANTATNVEYQFHGLASNTLAAVGADGTVNANMAYAPYGELIEAKEGGAAAVGIAAHRRRMNDKYVDELGGLAYYGARYYDNVLIGWTQADPKYRFAPDAAWAQPRHRNLYMFTLGNPVSYVDPDGLKAFRVTILEVVTDPKLSKQTQRAIEAFGAAIRSGPVGEALANSAHKRGSNVQVTYSTTKGRATGVHHAPSEIATDLLLIVIDRNNKASVNAAIEAAYRDTGYENSRQTVSEHAMVHGDEGDDTTGGVGFIGQGVAVLYADAIDLDSTYLDAVIARSANHEPTHATGVKHKGHGTFDLMKDKVWAGDAAKHMDMSTQDAETIDDYVQQVLGDDHSKIGCNNTKDCY